MLQFNLQANQGPQTRQERQVDILIIGGGTAGLSAAIYGLRSGRSVCIVEGNVHGGQIISTDTVENYPAIPQISGVDFANSLHQQATNLGAELLYEKVEKADLAGAVKTVTTDASVFQAKAVIIANGAQHRKLGCPGEETFAGRGVSYCATCDGALYRGKDVAIVGGGNTALEDALFLSNLCQKVYLIHRRDEFRGEKILVESVKGRPNIEILYDAVVEALEGEQTLQAAVIQNKKSGQSRRLDIAGVFIAVGLNPENQLFAGQVELDESGYVLAGEDCRTNLPGVFVAGDTRRKPLRQLVTAAADGAVAGTQAATYLNQGD